MEFYGQALTELSMILQEVIRQRKLELQRKEEKEKERKDQAELRKKNWIEEQKRYICFRAYLREGGALVRKGPWSYLFYDTCEIPT